MEHRLYRSRRDCMIGGVAGGLGEYLGIDPVIVRAFFIVLTLMMGWGVWLYVILWIVVPPAPLVNGAWGDSSGAAAGRAYHRLDARERSLLVGGTLVVLGVLLLMRELGHWWVALYRLWPLLLIVGGVALLIDRTRGG